MGYCGRTESTTPFHSDACRSPTAVCQRFLCQAKQNLSWAVAITTQPRSTSLKGNAFSKICNELSRNRGTQSELGEAKSIHGRMTSRQHALLCAPATPCRLKSFNRTPARVGCTRPEPNLPIPPGCSSAELTRY
eukprot:1842357-Pleurochrysis_carterae.AAC.1